MTDPELETVTIAPLADPPKRLLGTRRELNLLHYGPSEVLLARRDSEVVGAVRLALRDDPELRQGLITDLTVDAAFATRGVAERLIETAEQRLRAADVAKIDALIVDGQGLALPFYTLGYWSSRRTVVLGWDLSQLPEVGAPDHVEIVEEEHPDPAALARLILNSYQPYWTWWKETRKDRKWYRVELQPAERAGFAERAEGRIRDAFEHILRQANAPGQPPVYKPAGMSAAEK